MKNSIHEICRVEFTHCYNGHVIVYFKNQVTGAHRTQEYKNMAIANREAKKFENRMIRIYSNYNFD